MSEWLTVRRWEKTWNDRFKPQPYLLYKKPGSNANSDRDRREDLRRIDDAPFITGKFPSSSLIISFEGNIKTTNSFTAQQTHRSLSHPFIGESYHQKRSWHLLSVWWSLRLLQLHAAYLSWLHFLIVIVIIISLLRHPWDVSTRTRSLLRRRLVQPFIW